MHQWVRTAAVASEAASRIRATAGRAGAVARAQVRLEVTYWLAAAHGASLKALVADLKRADVVLTAREARLRVGRHADVAVIVGAADALATPWRFNRVVTRRARLDAA